jgi:hypothetical protein
MLIDWSTFQYATTIQMLLDEHRDIIIDCWDCGSTERNETAKLELQPETAVPALHRHFKCRGCGSETTSARPGSVAAPPSQKISAQLDSAGSAHL